MYTKKDWERDGILKLRIGQLVSNEVVTELLNNVPPTTYRHGIFQSGEPYSSNSNGEPLYSTFKMEEIGWIYVGLHTQY